MQPPPKPSIVRRARGLLLLLVGWLGRVGAARAHDGWERVPWTGPELDVVAPHPRRPSVVAASDLDGAVWASRDGGRTWERILGPLASMADRSERSAVAALEDRLEEVDEALAGEADLELGAVVDLVDPEDLEVEVEALVGRLQEHAEDLEARAGAELDLALRASDAFQSSPLGGARLAFGGDALVVGRSDGVWVGRLRDGAWRHPVREPVTCLVAGQRGWAAGGSDGLWAGGPDARGGLQRALPDRAIHWVGGSAELGFRASTDDGIWVWRPPSPPVRGEGPVADAADPASGAGPRPVDAPADCVPRTARGPDRTWSWCPSGIWSRATDPGTSGAPPEGAADREVPPLGPLLERVARGDERRGPPRGRFLPRLTLEGSFSPAVAWDPRSGGAGEAAAGWAVLASLEWSRRGRPYPMVIGDAPEVVLDRAGSAREVVARAEVEARAARVERAVALHRGLIALASGPVGADGSLAESVAWTLAVREVEAQLDALTEGAVSAWREEGT